MAERYTKVFAQQGQFYCQGAPVIIEAGALLKDNQTGKIIAQVKFKNISSQNIRALTVRISAWDISGNVVAGVDNFQYLDLNVSRDGTFGAKTPIALPDAVTRSFTCECRSAVFTNGDSWVCEENAQWVALPTPTPLNKKIATGLTEQYRRDTTSKAEYVVTDCEDLWYCACGAINRSQETLCHHCRSKKAALLAALNIDALSANKKNYDDAVAARQAEIEAEQQKRNQKNKKIGIIAGTVVALLIAIILLITKVIIPANDYKNANALLNGGEFIAAEQAFEALGTYKDSQTMVLECQYQQALYQIKNRNYDDAYKALRGLADYKDSLAQIRNSIFQRAKDHIEHKEYETAYYLLEDMDNEPDAQEIILEGKLREANDYIQAGDYDRGHGILNSLGQGNKVDESIYQRATLALTDKDYDLAHTLFVSLGDYEDSKTKALEAKYQKACDFLVDKNYDEANPIFEELEDYKDSKDKIHYHDYKVKDTKAANCTANGYNTYYCAGCQDGYTEQIKALGHDHKSTVTKEAACETQGICTYTCTRCSDSYTKPIDALGHNYSGATCTKASICSRCGSQEASALGHTTTTGVCSRCNYNFTQPLYLSGQSSGNIYVEIIRHDVSLPNGTYKLTITITVASYPKWDVYLYDRYLQPIDGSKIAESGTGTYSTTFTVERSRWEGTLAVALCGKYEVSIVPIN